MAESWGFCVALSASRRLFWAIKINYQTIFPNFHHKINFFTISMTKQTQKQVVKVCGNILSLLAVIYSTALLHTIFHCTATHCTTLHSTAMHCTALYCIALHWITLYFTELHCSEMRCAALHCSALPYTTLHCSVLFFLWFTMHY